MGSRRCPTCEKTFSTVQGTRQHHTKVHGDPLPNRTCTGCGGDFYDPKARREFCNDCNPNAGRYNGNWSDAKKGAACIRCGDSFEYYPSDKVGKYCSQCVQETDEFLGDPYAEVVNVERIERECDYCGRAMEVLASERNYGNGRFCSRDCLSAWMSENWTGENHHQWQGGSRRYAGRWWRARRKALERDGYRCKNCGKSADQIGRNPDVHHIRPLKEFDDPQRAHSINNLICLCRKCHRNAEEGNIDVPVPSSSQT